MSGPYTFTTSCDAPWPKLDWRGLRKLMGFIEPPAIPRFRILTHPNNRKLIVQAASGMAIDLPECSFTLDGIPVVFSEWMRERKTRDVWHPPSGDRFCGYGPEDETWMRPLGLGRLETIDDGPLFLKMVDQQ